jgi:outer membrane protein
MKNMHKNILCSALGAVFLSTLFTPLPAHAELGGIWAKERFQLRVRALGVVPEESSSVNIGGNVKVGNALVPEIDLTYFLTEHVAAEIIAGTARHDLTHSSGADLGKVWILPPTLTLQYHFTPENSFSPYVGAGINYSIMYGEDTASGFSDLDVGNGFGTALQAGFDYWVDDHWGLNLDVKKLWLNVDASLNQGTIRADVDLDPWLIGAGVSYRF